MGVLVDCCKTLDQVSVAFRTSPFQDRQGRGKIERAESSGSQVRTSEDLDPPWGRDLSSCLNSRSNTRASLCHLCSWQVQGLCPPPPWVISAPSRGPGGRWMEFKEEPPHAFSKRGWCICILPFQFSFDDIKGLTYALQRSARRA